MSDRFKQKAAMWYMSYIQNLQENPILTKAATAGVLGFLEEFSAQTITFENGRNWILPRMIRMSAYGAFINAPLGHFLYELLGRFVARFDSYQSVIQLAASNLVILPIQTWVYIASMGYMVNELSVEDTAKLLRKNFWPIMIVSIKYFPIIQLLVFKFVPQALWVPVFNLIALLFGIYVNVTTKKKEN